MAAKKCLDSGFKSSGERLELKECKSSNAEVNGEQVIIVLIDYILYRQFYLPVFFVILLNSNSL
jgi:hypothetical protein